MNPLSGKRIFLTGADGQVGFELARYLKMTGAQTTLGIFAPKCERFLGYPVVPVDLAQKDKLAQTLENINPDMIINPAAYTQVDKAETESEMAFAVNAHAMDVMGAFAKRREALLVHYSTDYVYNEPDPQPIPENGIVDPGTTYGRSKLAGEIAVRESGAAHVILRTSWVYGLNGANFVRTMLRLGREREELRVVDDQWGAPTAACSLALGTLQILMQSAPDLNGFFKEHGGTYNLCDGGVTSWCQFARRIFSEARQLGYEGKVHQVSPISTSEYPTPAKRPLNSRLDLSKIKQAFGVVPPHWEQSLDQTLYVIFKCGERTS